MGVRFFRGLDDTGVEVPTHIGMHAVEDMITLLARRDEDIK
jgi:hypothetical protein